MDTEGDWIYDEEGSWSKEDLEVCGLDGCPFKGSKSVLQDHILYLHRTGVYNRLTRENDPEEIAAWRKHRKNKYPTFTQTESHRLDQQSRKEQYEDISKARAEAFDLFMEERKKVTEKTPFSFKRKRNNKKQAKRRQNRLENKKKEDFLDDEEDPPGWNGPLMSFPGTKNFDELSESESEEEEEDQMIQDTFDISDDEEDVLLHTQLKEKRQLEKNIRKIKVEVCDDENIANPESDEDDEPPEEIAIIKKTNEILPQNNETHYPKKNEENVLVKDENSYDPEALDSQKTVCKGGNEKEKASRKRKHRSKSENSGHHFLERNEDDSHIPTPEQKPEIKSKEPSTQSLLLKNKQNLTKSPYCIEPPTLPRVRFNRISKQNKTLLEKLLSSEMKKEKKLILQSVKYICDNNFFL
ncbi:uncharacterized protein [Lepeophtheirus salmonis]|uniref:uncharacterized protein n=1 Tax=Lepeophtheirus salmonis TaxID=72036 RepID=UPI001AE53F6A|nr:uncharacterized protein LOC121127992 [Lepeophtheirus salmonis]